MYNGTDMIGLSTEYTTLSEEQLTPLPLPDSVALMAFSSRSLPAVSRIVKIVRKGVLLVSIARRRLRARRNELITQWPAS